MTCRGRPFHHGDFDVGNIRQPSTVLFDSAFQKKVCAAIFCHNLQNRTCKHVTNMPKPRAKQGLSSVCFGAVMVQWPYILKAFRPATTYFWRETSDNVGLQEESDAIASSHCSFRLQLAITCVMRT